MRIKRVINYIKEELESSHKEFVELDIYELAVEFKTSPHNIRYNYMPLLLSILKNEGYVIDADHMPIIIGKPNRDRKD
jgi:transcriptional regulator CtsR